MSENNKILKDVWIKKRFFDNVTVGSVIRNKVYELDDAYNIWYEANQRILESKGNKEKINQGFLSLKRAFNVTTKVLKKNIAIDNINYNNSTNKRYILGVLEYFEIIKPITIKRYLDMRNLIEHQNNLPPDIEICLSISEYIWNYIRNTAYIMDHFQERITFSNYSDSKIIFNYEIEENKGIYYPHLKVIGKIRPYYLSFIHINNCIKIENFDIFSKNSEEIKNNILNYSQDLSYIFFKGEILNHNAIANYVKFMVLPEYGGLEDGIRRIFEDI